RDAPGPVARALGRGAVAGLRGVRPALGAAEAPGRAAGAAAGVTRIRSRSQRSRGWGAANARERGRTLANETNESERNGSGLIAGEVCGLARAAVSSAGMPDVTRLLDLAARGDRGAAGQLLPLVYDELRRL